MRKNNLLNKTLLLSMAAVMSMSILAGCQSKKVQASAGNQGAANEQRQNGQFNAEDMKKRMEDNMSSLVADGTINQSQADKIVEALTANPQGFGGQRNRQNGNQNNGQNNGQNGQQNNQQNNGQGGQQNNQQNQQRNNNQNGQRNNALSKLVSDGVITQDQANAVMQKIRGGFNRNQNNKDNQNNQNNQNNSNGSKTS